MAGNPLSGILGLAGGISNPYLLIVIAIGLVVVVGFTFIFGLLIATYIIFFIPFILIVLGIWLFISPKRGIPAPYNFIFGIGLMIAGMASYYILKMM
jgi:uncharacterized membrane protein